MELGRIGIWSSLIRLASPPEAIAAAREIERMGLRAVWVPSGPPAQLKHVSSLLESTQSLVLGTSILNIYSEPDPKEVAHEFWRLDSLYPERLLLGIGAGHPERVDLDSPGRYRAPLSAVSEYLDGLDAAEHPVPVAKRALAALGPKMLDLAARRSAGALPYLTIPRHTADARAQIGKGKLLAVEQMVIFENDPIQARGLARARLRNYLQRTNYRNSFLRQGFTEEDLAGDGTDRLIDSIVAWGDLATVLQRIEQHLVVGANHVAVQVLAADDKAFPLTAWRRLAASI
jgi:probable F420-dependent oxidoreductase